MKQCFNCKKYFNDDLNYCPKCNRGLKILTKEEETLIDISIKESLTRSKRAYQQGNHISNKSYSNNKVAPQYTPKCPYCNSTDTEKISTGDRWVSIFFTGLGSGKIGKQWHCKKCGSNF